MKKNSTARTKKWCAENKDKVREYVRKRRAERRTWFDGILSELSCIKCGESHPATLDFHHRNPSEKEGQIGDMLGNLTSKEKILEEIKKCDVLCANCHRKHHYDEKEKL